jgi:nucleotide-binding universal stress UspA family protein
MFETGRPVMVAGDAVPERLGRHILVSWNGSTETARTLAMAHPFLCLAETVVVVTVEDGTVSGPTGEEAARHLARHGMDVRAETISADDDSVGGAVMRFARENDVDLILKGAFTHSRLRQMIFGGATNEILNKATIPVLFCH